MRVLLLSCLTASLCQVSFAQRELQPGDTLAGVMIPGDVEIKKNVVKSSENHAFDEYEVVVRREDGLLKYVDVNLNGQKVQTYDYLDMLMGKDNKYNFFYGEEKGKEDCKEDEKPETYAAQIPGDRKVIIKIDGLNDPNKNEVIVSKDNIVNGSAQCCMGGGTTLTIKKDMSKYIKELSAKYPASFFKSYKNANKKLRYKAESGPLEGRILSPIGAQESLIDAFNRCEKLGMRLPTSSELDKIQRSNFFSDFSNARSFTHSWSFEKASYPEGYYKIFEFDNSKFSSELASKNKEEINGSKLGYFVKKGDSVKMNRQRALPGGGIMSRQMFHVAEKTALYADSFDVPSYRVSKTIVDGEEKMESKFSEKEDKSFARKFNTSICINKTNDDLIEELSYLKREEKRLQAETENHQEIEDKINKGLESYPSEDEDMSSQARSIVWKMKNLREFKKKYDNDMSDILKKKKIFEKAKEASEVSPSDLQEILKQANADTEGYFPGTEMIPFEPEVSLDKKEKDETSSVTKPEVEGVELAIPRAALMIPEIPIESLVEDEEAGPLVENSEFLKMHDNKDAKK